MDIRVAVSSFGIFIVVFSMTLGIPIILYNKGQDFWAICSMGILATAAPIIYKHFRRKTEKNILRDEFERQDALLDTVRGFSQIRNVDEVARLLVESVMQVMQVEQIALYLFDGKDYVQNSALASKSFVKSIAGNNVVVMLAKDREAFLVDEVVREEALYLQAFYGFPPVAVVALCQDRRVIGLLFLGPKLNDAQYSDRDIRTFKLIAGPVAEAIERAYRNEREERSMHDDLQDQHLKRVATMGAGISHQVFNRMNLMGFALQNIEDILEFSQVIGEAEKNEMRESAATIRDHIKNSTQMTEGLKAANRPDGIKTNVSLRNLLERVQSMASDLRDRMEFEYAFLNEEDVTLYCAEAYLQEAFLNIFTNAIDAIRMYLDAPLGYKPMITASWRRDDGDVIIDITDNGPGFSPENLKKAFTPFHTTKGVGKGTGMGLDTIRRFIRLEEGSVDILSQLGQGATVRIRLPLKQESGNESAHC
ncbi:MAG: HAMP domain-containing sensor histidine kinase [Candidatus Omnitrophota bacterium]